MFILFLHLPWLADLCDLRMINVLHTISILSFKNSQGRGVRYVTHELLQIIQYAHVLPQTVNQEQRLHFIHNMTVSGHTSVSQADSSWNKQMRTGELWHVCTTDTNIRCVSLRFLNCRRHFLTWESSAPSSWWLKPKTQVGICYLGHACTHRGVWYVTADCSCSVVLVHVRFAFALCL